MDQFDFLVSVSNEIWQSPVFLQMGNVYMCGSLHDLYEIRLGIRGFVESGLLKSQFDNEFDRFFFTLLPDAPSVGSQSL
jgi:hypothetical protein